MAPAKRPRLRETSNAMSVALRPVINTFKARAAAMDGPVMVNNPAKRSRRPALEIGRSRDKITSPQVIRKES